MIRLRKPLTASPKKTILVFWLQLHSVQALESLPHRLLERRVQLVREIQHQRRRGVQGRDAEVQGNLRGRLCVCTARLRTFLRGKMKDASTQ